MATVYDTSLNEPLAAYSDRVFDATALANAGTVTSSVFRFAKVQSETEFVITANTEITVGDGATLSVVANWGAESDNSGWDAADTKTIDAYAPSGGTTVFAIGDVIARWTPETDVKHYVEIAITNSEDQSSTKVDGKIYRTA